MSQTIYDTDDASSNEKNGVAAVERALTILEAFTVKDSKLSLTDIARKTNLYKSTILRLLASLEKFGYIIRGEDGQYTLGSTVLRLSSIYQSSFSLKDVIYPVLKRVSAETGETSSFYILERNKRIILFRIEPERSIKVSISEGDIFPVGVGAAGKILLAFSSNPITPELVNIKRCAWASSFGERDIETSSLSVPVFGVYNRLEGALTISGPIDRLTKEVIDDFIPMLKQQSIFISQNLGASQEFLGNVFSLKDE